MNLNIYPAEDFKVILRTKESIKILPEAFDQFLKRRPRLYRDIMENKNNIHKIGKMNYEKHVYRFTIDEQEFELIFFIPLQKELSTLYSMIIHELKNPLAAIRAMVQVLEMSFNSDTMDQNTFNKYSRSILKEIDRMNRILSSIMKLSKPRTRFIQSFDLVSTIKKAISISLEEFKGNGVNIKIIINRKKIIFTGNPDEFHQIMNNLLKNSMHALEGVKNPRIEIKLEDRPEEIFLSISDNGKGMNEATLKKVMSHFHSTKPDGMGLGLFVVKTIVEKYNGNFEILSTEEKGTTVKLTFRKK